MTGGFNEGRRHGSLYLEDRLLFSTDLKSSEEGKLATSAVYFVTASLIDPGSGESLGPGQYYRLLVLEDTVADDEVWVNGEENDTTYPYVVPRSLAANGIVHYMEERFFAEDNPTAIDALRPYLQGPITDDYV